MIILLCFRLSFQYALFVLCQLPLPIETHSLPNPVGRSYNEAAWRENAEERICPVYKVGDRMVIDGGTVVFQYRRIEGESDK